jgi:hypothetical protein
MGSPKHLWSGDWREQSATAAAQRRRALEDLAQPVRPVQSPPPRAAPEPGARAPAARPSGAPGARLARARAARPSRRKRLSREELRRWAVTGGIALVAGFLTASAVALIVRADARRPARASLSQAPAAGPGRAGAPSVSRPAFGGAWMGVKMASRPAGEALIDAVVPRSPADAAGFLPGDVILAVDNTSVSSSADVTAVLSRLRPGQVVPVSASRGTAGFTAQVTLGARPRGYSVP